jgi:hypothetical protein
MNHLYNTNFVLKVIQTRILFNLMNISKSKYDSLKIMKNQIILSLNRFHPIDQHN